MTKVLPYTRAVSQMINTEALYLIEGYIYEKILPIIGDFGPRSVLLDKAEIIMEDLSEKGYTNCKRQNHLDLEHSLFTIQVFILLLVDHFYSYLSFFFLFSINFCLSSINLLRKFKSVSQLYTCIYIYIDKLVSFRKR